MSRDDAENYDSMLVMCVIERNWGIKEAVYMPKLLTCSRVEVNMASAKGDEFGA